MNNINFTDLPSDIKSIIYENNRKYNNDKNRDKKLQEIWDEWGEDYEEEIYELYVNVKDGDLISTDWKDLPMKDQIDFYKLHLERLAEPPALVWRAGEPAPEGYWL